MATATYSSKQIDVRDTESALLDCFGASSSATAGRIIRLLFSGGSSNAPVPPQPPAALHLGPAGVVGRLDH